MKRLYLIGGAMGVGKTTVCQILKKKCPNSVFLDGDWCWDADPFILTEETKAMVMDNVCHLLGNFLACTAYENVIFGWVMHEQSIIEEILSRISVDGVEVHILTLICSPETLKARLQQDIDNRLRTVDVIDRALDRLAATERLTTRRVDTEGRTPDEIACQILNVR